jgi:YegS/Rv2252/BmrU family lipid kinase
MKALLIYNPQAGHGRAKKLLPQVEFLFNKHNIEFDLCLTDYPEHGIEIVRGINFDNYDCLVAAGGDGTLFEIINGYYKNVSSKQLPLGILPIGTGNAFARDLELDNNHIEDAIKIIGNKTPRKVDVGYFKTHGQEYYFLNIVCLGFVADVNETAQKLKLFGNLSYTLGVFYRTLFLKTNHVTLDIDGKQIERESTFIEISNTRYTANFLMAPNAKIDDGLLDITLAKKFSRRRLIQCFPKIFTGDHIHLDEVETYQTSHILINTDEPKVLTPDGELIGITPVEIKCLPRAIEVFWR